MVQGIGGFGWLRLLVGGVSRLGRGAGLRVDPLLCRGLGRISLSLIYF